MKAILQQQPGHLLEPDRSNEAKRLKSMDLSFEFGCSLNLSFIREKMELADVVCASEEVAKMLAPEEAADVEIMLREQAGLSADLRICDGCGFCRKAGALTVDLLVQNFSPHSNRGSEGAVTTRLYTNMEGINGSKKIPCGQMDIQKKKLLRKQSDAFSVTVTSDEKLCLFK